MLRSRFCLLIYTLAWVFIDGLGLYFQCSVCWTTLWRRR
jgi:hypothetical protein